MTIRRHTEGCNKRHRLKKDEQSSDFTQIAAAIRSEESTPYVS